MEALDPIDRLNPYITGYRPGQKEAIKGIIQEAKEGRQVIQLDAGVGAGKSLILTVAARALIRELALNKAIYTTPQVKLVEQLQKDKYLNVPALVGKANYPCLLSSTLFPITADECPLPKRQRKLVCSKCEYQRAKEAFDNARLGAVTIDKLLFDRSIESPDVLIVDESSGLENKLINQSEISLPNDIKTATREAFIESLETWEKDLKDEGKRLGDAQVLAAMAVNEKDDKALKEATRLGKQLRSNDQKLHKVEYLLAILAEGQKYVIDKDRKFKSLDGKRQFKRLISYPSIVILASGTPCPQMLTNDYAIVSMSNPIPEERRLIYYDPVGKMSSAVREETIGKMGPKIAELHKKFNKNTLVHCHSFACAESLGNVVADNGVEVYQMVREDKTGDVIRRWNQSDNAVLMSVGCEEGLDLKGPKYPLNIIAVVPFGFRGDIWVTEREKEDKAQDLHYSQKHGIVSTAVAIQQAAGRIVRGPEDVCGDGSPKQTFILDANFGWFCKRHRAAFKPDFLQSIRVRASA